MKLILKKLDELIIARYRRRYVQLINARSFSFEDVRNSYLGEPLLGDLIAWWISALFTSMIILISLDKPSLLDPTNKAINISYNLCMFISLAFTAFIIHGHIFLHHFLPGKNEREAVIQKQVEEVIREKQDVYITERMNQSNLVSELRNPKLFCQKYFNKKASGFIDFYVKRVFNFDKSVDFEFLYYSLLIPKKKELSVDALRKILLVRKKVMPLNLSAAISKVEVFFSEYSLNQVENIFTMGKNDDYFRELINQSECEPLPVYKSFAEAQEFRALKRKIYHPSLLELHNISHEKWVFKVLQTKESYQQASADFSNCVKVYFEAESDIVLVFQDSLPYACVEIKGKKINEMSAHRNFPVLEEKPLRSFLKIYLK